MRARIRTRLRMCLHMRTLLRTRTRTRKRVRIHRVGGCALALVVLQVWVPSRMGARAHRFARSCALLLCYSA